MFLFLGILSACSPNNEKTLIKPEKDSTINHLMEKWHKAAAQADFDRYFDLMADSNFTYIGTDATENWSKQTFAHFCKPYFDKKTTWDFKTLNRNIFFSDDYQNAWFDEILDTHMGTCRGSGVLIKINNQWKIKHYVLSLAIPNPDMGKVKQIIAENDSIFRHNFPHRQ
ncbi:MAG: nuclear transport factor 2 family protein [Flavobacteriales bacterium]|nr:nuclear transport factor 2 family protein [Flavobacteriales bacterium]